ncbi:MAG: hypothetical protein DWQ10_07255 [Calditrichaeota bacterium]|nr:MAG: hypothetical protein DWQ10_07255 [Calditrichota bacterium]
MFENIQISTLEYIIALRNSAFKLNSFVSKLRQNSFESYRVAGTRFEIVQCSFYTNGVTL